jgi:signal transduction histidine kinase
VVDTGEHIRTGAPTLPTFWASACVLVWAVSLGLGGGLAAAALVAAADQVIRPGGVGVTFSNAFLLVLAGAVVGHVAELVRAAEAERIRAAELSAATTERERLARDIHDGVLQVLALVARRGAEVGGETAELGRLAGEQERALRLLVGAAPSTADGEADLVELLRAVVSPDVTLVAPAGTVAVGVGPGRELAAAVAAALDNVARHAGAAAKAWVLVEDDAGVLTVTVRDDGPGIPVGRLAAAAAEGRLGVAQSIVGRLRALGGDAVITAAPGQGTEVELRFPA